jgi:hypothetical protein
MDKRAEFVRQWFDRAQESMDDFERYIFLYLCLVVVIKAWAGNNSVRPGAQVEPDDGWFVNEYFGSRFTAETIVKIAESIPSFKSLVLRKSDENDCIVDTNTDRDKWVLKNLYQHYRFGSVLPKRDISMGVGTALKAIRNNLFHGGKFYESERDQILLASAVPLLEALVKDAAKRDLSLTLVTKPTVND